MNSTIKRLLVFLGLLVATAGSISIIYFTTQVYYDIHQISNVATLSTVGIGVYWDITSTNEVTFIDWGAFSPGESKNVTVYVKNTGSTLISGSIDTNNWIPEEANQYISLSWNFGEAKLSPNRVRTVNFTLSVNSNIQNITNFSFNIIVTGVS